MEVINFEPRTAIIEDLQRCYDNGKETDLRNKLQEIIDEINLTTNPKSKIRKNLLAWKTKYINKIDRLQYLDVNKYDKYMNAEGKVNEFFVEEFIFNFGLCFNDIEIKEFERQKIIKLNNLNIGVIDLLGHYNDSKVIIEIKGFSAKSSVLGQVLAYWQYFKIIDNKEYPIIIIAPRYSRQYILALSALKSLSNVKIQSLIYKMIGDTLTLKKF